MKKFLLTSLIASLVVVATFITMINITFANEIDSSPETRLGADKGYKSVYTPLSNLNCININEWQGGVEQECAGIAGFRVHLVDDDNRQSLTLIKNGKTYPLEFWRTVSPDFSELGKLIEWRVDADTDNHTISPVALIVRLKTSGENPSSDLVVVDLERDNICVVDVIPPNSDGTQNEIARSMANQATALNCLEGAPIIHEGIE